MLVDCLGGTLLQRFIYRFDFFGKYILFLHRTVPDVSILKRKLYLWDMRKTILLLAAVLLLGACSDRAAVQMQPVRHIILWTLNDSIDDARKAEIIRTTCENFYTLKDRIPGIVSMDAVYQGVLPSSNCDFMFDITFESKDALSNFSTHPEHLKSAGAIKPYISSRACLDIQLPISK